HAHNLLISGDLAEGWALLERAWETADRENHRGAAFTATWTAASLSAQLGDYKEEVRWCQRELSKPRTAQSPIRRKFLLDLLASAFAYLGEVSEARRISNTLDWPLLQGYRLFV